jgi:hypothetical protein
VTQQLPPTVAGHCSPHAVGPLGVVVAEQDPEDIDAFEQVGRWRTGRVRAEVGAVDRYHKVRLPWPGVTELVHIRSHSGLQQGAEADVALDVVTTEDRPFR